MIDRCVITIAVGKPYYLKLAQNLLLSFLLWNKENDVNFLLLTDDPDFFKKYSTTPKVSIKSIKLNDADKSFTSKFTLFEHAVAKTNLFIDCDCIIYRDLTYIFDSFKNKSFSAIGTVISQGEFFCDVEKTIARFKLPAMPKFVGSVYYFKKDDKAAAIFNEAKNLKSKYDEFGFVRLRDKENEEPLFAIALATHGEQLLPNNGTIKADAMYYKKITCNVLQGKAHTKLPINDITGGEIIPATCTPGILHFNALFSSGYLYKSESLRLRNQQANKYLTGIICFVKYALPAIIIINTKNALRALIRRN